MSATIFERICAKEIPADIVYEDEMIVAFRDVKPAAPVHVLLVPRKAIPDLEQTNTGDESLLGWLLLKAPEVARRAGLTSGYRLVINNGADAGQVVPHVHCHLLGGRELGWPPG